MSMIQETLTKANALFLLAKDCDLEVDKIETAIEKADQFAILQKQAMVLLQHASDTIQKDIKEALTSLCSTALQDVFPDKNCTFEVDFVTTKNTTNLEMYIVEDGIRYDPLESRGHGMVDVLCFALRVSLLCLKPEIRKVILLDEPFKQVSAEYRDRAIEFVKDVSLRTGIQIIMVTHIDEFAKYADKVLHVSYKDGKSIVKEM